MRDAIAWVNAVRRHWVPLLTGSSIAVAIGMGEHYTGQAIHWSWYLRIVGLCLLIAVFQAWQTEHRALVKERSKNDARCMPNIVLAPNGFRVETRYFGSGGNYTRPLSCLNVYFINDPEFPTEKSMARNISATLVYRNGANQAELYSLNGRWGDTPQPASVADVQTSVERLPVDFPIGVQRELNLAFKHPPDAECYGFSNHSYGSPDWRIPERRLSGEEFIVEVRLRGPYVDRSWSFRFRNPGRGRELETVEWGQIEFRVSSAI